ncbi:hypothetical protein K8O96_16700 [Clostridium sporogenes]|uniref:Uncharacterized protein n=1 Tax=Clostridium botulinum TaxID=1491 RepID=A0A6M0T081_CLOBO|nr:hypothetical protein [Clostridium sporogenes]NFA60192.1 hypothetical protein [Clostridium botulinum]NFI72833.1 hypothetical protein [Clostridium sporogenes]NFL72380.1 hypothetical protein [Clostridium sporogenes]NFM23393.1 hypothetical protein [Clostridium sporogenes]NFP60246.1 hypothetical protein [Clostridium sporogenes]
MDILYKLKKLLNKAGKIIIADVEFKKEVDLLKCRNININIWHNDETYMVAEKIEPLLYNKDINFKYTQIFSCAGVLEID